MLKQIQIHMYKQLQHFEAYLCIEIEVQLQLERLGNERVRVIAVVEINAALEIPNPDELRSLKNKVLIRLHATNKATFELLLRTHCELCRHEGEVSFPLYHKLF